MIIFCETNHNIYYSYKHSELPIIIKLTFFPGSFCFLSGTNNQKIRKSSTRIFFKKSHFSRSMSPMCNNIFNVQHFFGDFRCCTLVATGVFEFAIWIKKSLWNLFFIISLWILYDFPGIQYLLNELTSDPLSIWRIDY